MLWLLFTLAVCALLLAIASTRPNWPVLWVAVVLIAFVECVRTFPTLVH